MTTNGIKNGRPMKPTTLYVVCPKCRTLAGTCETAAEVGRWPTCSACGTATTITKRDPNRRPAKRGGMDPNLYFTPEEMDLITAHVATLARRNKSHEAQRTKLIVQILACSAIRAQELCDLQMRDLPAPGGPCVIYVRDGKGNVSAPVHVPSSLVKQICDYLVVWRADAKPESTLFEGRTGEPMKYLVLYRKLRKIGEELGLRTTLSPHKLRRSYGVKFYAQENDLLGLQEQLRHACLTSTQKYAKTMPGPLRRQVEKMGGR